eukprot:NODE_1159_length_2093_cov_58.914213_g476_i2.p1 GENE.NODE_1159_length_2093_cov_58.914213_g476_i2~~NODE_1159_length_2093_cov_58.914213_g476_i2.p1  ORF type:complete len:397 (+),score=39.15 NODE_1159_length_2093_cov_58.914213_g476_i2:32-1192(+)
MSSVSFCIQFSAIENQIDKSIIFRGRNSNCSQFTYVQKVVELNQKSLCSKCGISNVFVDDSCCWVQGSSQSVQLAKQEIVNVLSRPCLSLQIQPEFVVALRLLNQVKRDFSEKTGCWLHFIWCKRIVQCYGIDSNNANQYITSLIDYVKANDKAGTDPSKPFAILRTYDRSASSVLKKNIEYIESFSGALIGIVEVKSSGATVQLFGTLQSLETALELIDREVLNKSNEENSTISATETGLKLEAKHSPRSDTELSVGPENSPTEELPRIPGSSGNVSNISEFYDSNWSVQAMGSMNMDISLWNQPELDKIIAPTYDPTDPIIPGEVSKDMAVCKILEALNIAKVETTWFINLLKYINSTKVDLSELVALIEKRHQPTDEIYDRTF